MGRAGTAHWLRAPGNSPDAAWLASGGSHGQECPVSAAELGWPVERAVSLLAGGFGLASLALGRAHHPRWRIMTGLISANLVLQAAVGWCPASLALHKLGVRTAAEKVRELR